MSVEFYERFDEDEDMGEFDDEDMIKNYRLPMSKEQVWEAFLSLNRSGQNWVFSKIKEL